MKIRNKSTFMPFPFIENNRHKNQIHFHRVVLNVEFKLFPYYYNIISDPVYNGSESDKNK